MEKRGQCVQTSTQNRAIKDQRHNQVGLEQHMVKIKR